MSGYPLKKAITVTVVVGASGTGTATFYGNEHIFCYAIISPAAGANIEFLDADGYGLSGAKNLAIKDNIPYEFRIGANDGATTVNISGPIGTYTIKLWPKSF